MPGVTSLARGPGRRYNPCVEAAARITKLRVPPRRLPAGLLCAACLTPAGLFWSLFFSLSALYPTLFSADPRPIRTLGLRLSGVQAPAAILGVQPLGADFNGKPLARVTYHYKDGQGRSWLSVAVDFADPWKEGDLGTVVYLRSQPGVSRLRGEGQQPYGLFGWVLWLFPFSAMVLGSPAWRKGLDAVLLLRDGIAAEARIGSSERVRRWGRERERMVYEFESAEGRTIRGSSDLPADAAFQGAQRLPVLYRPAQPQISALVDSLPERYAAAVDGRGEWVYRGSRWPATRVAAAGALLAAAASCLVLHWAGFLPYLGR